jgi:hypothetical protein
MTYATAATTAQPGCRTTTAVADVSPATVTSLAAAAAVTSAKTAVILAAAGSARQQRSLGVGNAAATVRTQRQLQRLRFCSFLSDDGTASATSQLQRLACALR